MPTWNIGEYWTYRGSSYPGIPNNAGTENLQVVSVETLAMEGRNYSTYHVVIQESLNGTERVFSYDRWYTTSDLGLLRERMSSPNHTGSMTYSPPLALRWPLAPNATWRSTGNITFTDEYLGYPPQSYRTPYSIQFSTEPSRQLNVPAGTFEVIPVLRGDPSNGERQYWSTSVGNYVRVDSLQNGQTTLRAVLISHGHVAPPGGWLGLPLLVALGAAGALGFSATIALASRRKRLRASVRLPEGQVDQPKTSMPPPKG
jgi:hypothetical protein